MNGLLRAHLILLTTTIIGGFNYSISKIIMPDFVQPSAIILIRGAAAILFFWSIHSIFIKEKIAGKKDFARLFICSVFGISANQIFFYEGLNMTTPINASLLQCGVPVFVMLISFGMMREKITTLKIAGLITGGSGAVLLLINSSNNQITQSHTGDIFIILNAACYAIFLVLVKPLSEKYNPFTIMKWIFLLGTIMSIPFGYNQLMQVDWQIIPYQAWLSLGFVVVFATIINYSLNVSVLRFVNASVAGIYIYLIPVVATIVAISIGKDYLTVEKLGYAALILTGVYLVSRKTKES